MMESMFSNAVKNAARGFDVPWMKALIFSPNSSSHENQNMLYEHFMEWLVLFYSFASDQSYVYDSVTLDALFGSRNVGSF